MMQDEYRGLIMSIGENLKRLRRDKGWTQSELAEKCKVRFGQISKIERDETDPKLSTIYSLLNALECSADALLVDTNKSNADTVLAIALERLKQLPEKDKKILLTIIDKYCIAVSMQMMTEKNALFGITLMKGNTPEMIRDIDE
jgi:transcriptional regulator with XRE-family HTH domain